MNSKLLYICFKLVFADDDALGLCNGKCIWRQTVPKAGKHIYALRMFSMLHAFIFEV